MSDELSIPADLEFFISTELTPKLIELRRLGVTRLDADLTGMNIRLRLAPKAERVQISLISIPLTTDGLAS